MYSFFYIYFIKNFIQFHGYFKASNFTEVVVSSRDAQDTAIKTESTDSEHWELWKGLLFSKGMIVIQ